MCAPVCSVTEQHTNVRLTSKPTKANQNNMRPREANGQRSPETRGLLSRTQRCRELKTQPTSERSEKRADTPARYDVYPEVACRKSLNRKQLAQKKQQARRRTLKRKIKTNVGITTGKTKIQGSAHPLHEHQNRNDNDLQIRFYCKLFQFKYHCFCFTFFFISPYKHVSRWFTSSLTSRYSFSAPQPNISVFCRIS